ncbi:hypothetical protein [Pelagivirga sediminicola]|uniref:hypothetical protein n=1 Tax=Pelagivirga sediminicola TaxID=2170575 RepID=UPI001FAEA13D|nr:hypothetical protein [Pelagivirga sediminicola]
MIDVSWMTSRISSLVAPSRSAFCMLRRKAALGALIIAAVAPLVIYKFTTTGSLALVDTFAGAEASRLILGDGNGTLFSAVAGWLDRSIDAVARAGGGVFGAITSGVRAVLDALAVALNGTPWPAVMLVIIVTAWRSAGPRAAIFTTAALACIALLGYWPSRWRRSRWSARRPSSASPSAFPWASGSASRAAPSPPPSPCWT